MLIKVENGKKCFKTVMCFSPKDQFVWEIGPVRITLNGRTNEKYVYQASRQFIDKLSEILVHLQIEKPELKGSAERSAGHLKNMQTYMDLVKPMVPGPRGEGNVVEVKKAVKSSNVILNSNSDILIVTFID